MNRISRTFSTSSSSKEEDTVTTLAEVEDEQFIKWTVPKISKGSVYKHQFLPDSRVRLEEKTVSIAGDHTVIQMLPKDAGDYTVIQILPKDLIKS